MPQNEIELNNALQVLRPQLGDKAPIVLYRLVRLVAFEEILGRGASGTAYLAGKRLGRALELPDLEAFLKLCSDLNIGIVKVPLMTETEMHVDVHECVTCSGMAPVGRCLCSFEGGLIAGVVEFVTGKKTKAKEVTCIGGLGDETCGFDLTLE